MLSPFQVSNKVAGSKYLLSVSVQEAYQAYENHQNNAPVAVLRDALRLEPIGPEIDLDEVEPTENIMKRFCTGGMSLGAISRETHETISIAMNRINGKASSTAGEHMRDCIAMNCINHKTLYRRCTDRGPRRPFPLLHELHQW